MSRTVETIVVAGGGTMGAGIAFVAARAGFAVDMIEPDAAAQERARRRIASDAERANLPDLAGSIQYYSQPQSSASAILAIEAVPENVQLKCDVLRSLAAVLDPRVILATNTSSLCVSDIAAEIDHPERVLGMHFFNPPPAMQLVEIVRAEQTGDAALSRARELAQRFGKTAVVVADTPGFIVNRVARPYYLQSLRAFAQGVAPVEDLDRLARGVGFRMGPFELMDLIGIDVNLATSQSVYERLDAARLEPVQIQRDMVAEDRLGRKTGSGFYDYAQGPPPRDDRVPDPPSELVTDETVVVIGYGNLAYEMVERLRKRYAAVSLCENDDDLGSIDRHTTLVFDTGDGVSDRTPILQQIDAALPEHCVIFVDAYATDVSAAARAIKYPQRLVGYGILCSLEDQRCVEIVDADQTGDDALELAQDVFESLRRHVTLVEDRAGLFLGRTLASIVNEAVSVVEEGVATANDVDLAMRLGTNYPKGPLEWGREIGGRRIARILSRLARAEGAAFEPHRALWVLDVQQSEEPFAATAAEEPPE